MLRVAGIQIASVFLDAEKTWEKLTGYIREAQSEGAELVTWGETLIPGYPGWVWAYDEGRRDDAKQRTAYAKYWREALRLDQSEIIDEMRTLAKELGVMLMGGIAEKEGSSIYCTLLTISGEGEILGRHRKIKPSWYERLVWADGDGKGLKTHPIKGVRVGGLNCWENWLPLARAALHLQGEIIHVAVWPGNLYSTKDITRFIALEGRSWVISTSGFRPTDFSHLDVDEFPFKEMLPSFLRASALHRARWNGGSMAVDPTGEIVAGPLVDEEGIIYFDVDPMVAIQERQKLDISGHYSRFDIFNKPIKKIAC